MKLNAKHIWSGLIFITSIVALWLAASFTAKLIMYARFNKVALGTTSHWGVLSYSDNEHYVCVDYHYYIYGDKYCAQYMYPSPKFINKEGAQDAIERMEKEKVTVWYWARDTKEPLSVLERIFPYKELIRLSIALGILIYFYWLRSYLRVFSPGSDESSSPSAT